MIFTVKMINGDSQDITIPVDSIEEARLWMNGGGDREAIISPFINIGKVVILNWHQIVSLTPKK